MTATPTSSRCAGILMPLFSMSSSAGWGIGEIGDLPRMAEWCRRAGCTMLQLLPVNEMPLMESSPYSSLSAMAIDPQFISLSQVRDFDAIGGEAALEPELRQQLAEVRQAARIDYRAVRSLKNTVLRKCFAHFQACEVRAATERAKAFAAYVEATRWWLDDYALFRALKAHHGEHQWTEWPVGVQTRQPKALEAARHELADEIAYRKYVQWLADTQWSAARRECGDVRLFGDMPFMVSGDSADVWARQDEFRLDVSVGVPPDAFSETGQDWKLPLYRWDVFAARDFEWLRHRAKRYATLYDGYRVDHLVGFYRTYFRPHDGSPAEFSPSEQDDQERLGERVLGVFRESARVIAEDLGVIPDFVRASLARIQMPGYKVFRWERQWKVEGQPFVDPSDYPPTSAATSGTHDTEPMVVWWEGAPAEEREAVLALPWIQQHLSEDRRTKALAGSSLDPALRTAILEGLFASGSDYLILPLGDVFGWRDRINQPATIGPANWTWRLPWPSERLSEEREALEVARVLRTWSVRHRRTL